MIITVDRTRHDDLKMLYFIIVFAYTIKILTGRCKYILYKYYLIQIISSRECSYVQIYTVKNNTETVIKNEQ